MQNLKRAKEIEWRSSDLFNKAHINWYSLFWERPLRISVVRDGTLAWGRLSFSLIYLEDLLQVKK